MKLLICIIVAIVAIGLSNANQNNDIPVLISSKISIQTSESLPIAKPLDSHDFSSSYLTNLFPSSRNDKYKKVAIILGDDLTNEDVSNNIDKIKRKPIKYYPSVHNGYTELKEYLDNNKFTVEIFQTSNLNDAINQFINKQNDYNFIGVVLTTLDFVQTHDEHKHKSKRQAPMPKPVADFIYNKNTTAQYVFGEQCAALFHSVYIKNLTSGLQTPVYTYLTVSSANFTCVNSTNSTTFELQFNAGNGTEWISDLKITFDRFTRSWKMNQNSTVVTTNTGKQYSLTYMSTPYSMETPLRYSYACTSSRFKFYNSSDFKTQVRLEIYIDGFQLQPFDTKLNNTQYTFGQVNYCSGFFSNGIWMGIIASLIMVAILTAGITAMSTINVMDRFDDPRGKPLLLGIEK